MIWVVAVELAFLVGLPVLLMWIADRFMGRKPAIVIGLIATAFVAYAILNTYITCRAPPDFVASGGAALYNCDGAGGGIAYFFVWGTGPVALALLAAATVYHWAKFQRYQ
jgi:hypothetical protein